MSDFINTIDLLGDSVVFASLVDRSITEIKDNVVTNISEFTFYRCLDLTIVDFPQVTVIGAYAFNGCTRLNTVILRSPTVTTLSNTNAFTNTPLASGAGYIYVPSVLVNTYKSATNWSTYASKFRAIEDYPDICGG